MESASASVSRRGAECRAPRGSFLFRVEKECDREILQLVPMHSIMSVGCDESDEDAGLGDMRMSDIMRRAATRRSLAKARARTLHRALMWEVMLMSALFCDGVLHELRKRRAYNVLSRLIIPVVLKRRLRRAQQRRRFVGSIDAPARPTLSQLAAMAPYFANFSPNDLDALLGLLECISFDAGEHLVRTGEVSYSLLHIAKGICICNNQKILPRDHFGDVLGVPLPATHTISAKTHVIAWRLTRQSFLAVLERTSLRTKELIAGAFLQRSLQAISKVYPICPALLARVELLEHLHDELQYCEAAGRHFEPCVFSEGETLKPIQQQSVTVFIVLAGAFVSSVSKKTTHVGSCESASWAPKMPLLGLDAYLLGEPQNDTYTVRSSMLKCYAVPAAQLVGLLLEKSSVLVDHRSQLLRRRARKMRFNREWLSQVPLLRHVQLQRVGKVLDALEARCVEKGMMLCQAQQPVREIYLVLHGIVRDAADISVQPPLLDPPSPPEVREMGSVVPSRGTRVRKAEERIPPVDAHDLAREGHSRLKYALGGTWEGLYTEKWSRGWEAASVVEFWALPVGAIRTEYLVLPKPARNQLWQMCWTAMAAELCLPATVTGHPPDWEEARVTAKRGQPAGGSNERIPPRTPTRPGEPSPRADGSVSRSLASWVESPSRRPLTGSSLTRHTRALGSRRASAVRRDTADWISDHDDDAPATSGGMGTRRRSAVSIVPPHHRLTDESQFLTAKDFDDFKELRISDRELRKRRQRRRPMAAAIEDKLRHLPPRVSSARPSGGEALPPALTLEDFSCLLQGAEKLDLRTRVISAPSPPCTSATATSRTSSGRHRWPTASPSWFGWSEGRSETAGRLGVGDAQRRHLVAALVNTLPEVSPRSTRATRVEALAALPIESLR